MEYNSLVARRLTMTSTADYAYDQVLYESYPRPQTHPDHLATLAMLFGMSPAPAENCRVLELGCGDGANLIPMALTLPGSRFVGVDLGGVPIRMARELAGRLALANIVFHQLDIVGVDRDFGEFDYIIAHGLYSWIPAGFRDKLLAVSKSNLAPNGVAYVSYNTYPGGHVRDMVREMLLYQVRGIADPQLKIKHAFALLNFLAGSEPKAAALREELESIRSRSLSQLFHDDLAEVNEPVYFHQFMAHAQKHGLQFLAESEFFTMRPTGFSEETTGTVDLLAKGDRVVEQQYLDFLRCRRFRQTLLCHREIPLQNPPEARRVAQMYVSSSARPVREIHDAGSDAEEEFQAANGASMKTDLPLAKAAILHLAKQWPRVVPFDELVREAKPVPSADDVSALADFLLKVYSAGLVELQAFPSRFTVSVSERPAAFSLARLQAQTGTVVTTLRHSSVELEEMLVRHLVTLLDGTRAHAELLMALQALVGAGGQPRPLQAVDLERNLDGLARLALLEY